VGSVRDDLEATSEIPRLERLVGKDGKTRPRKQPRKRPATPAENFDEQDIDELEDKEEAERGDKQAARTFAKALRAYADALGQPMGDASDLPDEVKLQMFAVGISAGDAIVFKGGAPTDQAWERMAPPQGGRDHGCGVAGRAYRSYQEVCGGRYDRALQFGR
jgi:hypothetical protein